MTTKQKAEQFAKRLGKDYTIGGVYEIEVITNIEVSHTVEHWALTPKGEVIGRDLDSDLYANWIKNQEEAKSTTRNKEYR